MTRLCFCILGKIIRESGHIDYNFLVNLFTRQLYCYTSDTTGYFPVIAVEKRQATQSMHWCTRDISMLSGDESLGR